MIDTGVKFWLRHVEDRGGLWEPAGDSVLVMLPPELGQRYRFADSLRVTSDPDVAREDGVTLLSAGHPVLTEAAESVLSEGDAGLLLLDQPVATRPADQQLLDQARTQLPVGHGRIDLAGPSHPVTRWLLRVGVLASYTVSAEDRFQEQLERWVDVASRREVPAAVVDVLASAPVSEKDQWPAVPLEQLAPALREAHRLAELDAIRRRTALSKQLDDGHERERVRAVSYYADVIAGIERRLETIAPERRTLLAERLVSTQEERDRRLAEIAEKHQARHDLRPYRLHLVGVPAVRLPVDVRRGERRYPLVLDWLAPARAFAEPRCPTCDTAAPLVAGKGKLGCLSCLTPAARVGPPPVPAQKRPAATQQPPKPPLAPPQQQPTTASARTAVPTRRVTAERQAMPQQRTPARQRAAPKQAEKLAAAVWNAVAARRAGKLRDAVAPHSPAAALLHLYGVDGPRHAIGAPLHEELQAFTTASSWLTEQTGVTAGAVQTNGGEYPYALHWRADYRTLSVIEVLSAPPYPDGRLSRFYWWAGGGERAAQPSAKPIALDEVARLLASVGVQWHGIDVTARALAAWWRLGGLSLPADQPAVTAAAVHRLVAGRAGDKGLFRDAADAYRVDETAVRRVDSVLRRALALGPARAW